MIRSLRMQPNRKLYFKELPMPPTPGPGEVQVRMAFASICGYDMMMLWFFSNIPLCKRTQEKARGTSSVEVKKQTWKNMKILGTLACVGVLGMGVIGNSVMAAESTGNTNVFYASNSTQMLL